MTQPTTTRVLVTPRRDEHRRVRNARQMPTMPMDVHWREPVASPDDPLSPQKSFAGALPGAFHAEPEGARHAWDLADPHRDDSLPGSVRTTLPGWRRGWRQCRPTFCACRSGGRAPRPSPEWLHVWRWSFPAMLKGWIDRVWGQGWTCDFTVRQSRALPALERAALPCPAGSTAATCRRCGSLEAMRRSSDAGVPCSRGMDDLAMHVFPGVDDDSGARPASPAWARRVGRDLAAEPSASAMSCLSLPVL